MTSKKKNIILPLLLIFTLITFGLVYLKSDSFNQRMREALQLRLQELTGAAISVGDFRLEFFPLRAILRDVTFSKFRGVHHPFLKIAEIGAQPDWKMLMGSNQLVSLDLRSPAVHLDFEPDGSNNLPDDSRSSEPVDFFQIIVERLTVSGGTLHVNEKGTDLEMDLGKLSLSAHYSAGTRSYRCRIAYQEGTIQFDGRPWEHQLDLELEASREEIQVKRLMALGKHYRIDGQGKLPDPLSGPAYFSYQGLVDAEIFKRFYPGIGRTEGRTHFRGTLTVESGGWTTKGELSSESLWINGAPIKKLSSSFLSDSEQILFDKVHIDGLRGKSQGSFAVRSPWTQPLYRTKMTFQRIDLRELLLLVRMGAEELKLAGSLDGKFRAEWKDQWKELAGSGHLLIKAPQGSLAEAPERGRSVPVEGNLNFRLERGGIRFDDSHLGLAHSRAEFSGGLSAGGISDLRVGLQSQDLQELWFLGLDLRGEARFQGFLNGSWRDPQFQGTLTAHDLYFRKFSLGQVSGEIKGNRAEIGLNAVNITQGNSRAQLNGKVFMDPKRFRPTGALDLSVEISDASSRDLYATLGNDFPASGVVSGEFTLAGQFPDILLQGSLRSREGKIWDQPYDEAFMEISYSTPMLEVKRLKIRRGSGEIAGSAQIDLRRETLRSAVTARQLPLEEFRASHLPTTVSGLLRQFRLDLQGPWTQPDVKGTMEIEGMKLANEPLGDFHAEVHTSGEKIYFTCRSLSSEVDLVGRGTIALNSRYDFDAQVAFNNFSFTPFIKKVMPVAPETLTSQANGKVVITGPLSNPSQVSAKGTLSSIKVQFRQTDLQTSHPLTFAISNQRISIQDASFQGKGTVLKLDGQIDLSPPQRLDLRLEGDYDLKLLSEFSPQLTASGIGKVNASIRGTLTDPHIQGSGKISQGLFAYGKLPNSLSEIEATLFFDQNRIKVADLSAVSGGGQVQMEGGLFFDEQTIQSLNLDIQARGVRIRYPEGMRNRIDADLALRGSEKAQLLSGKVRVLDASFRKGYDPITEYLENPRRNDFGESPGLAGNLNLDLTITANQNIELDTPLIKMTARADLKLKGTTTNPLVTGSIEASGGRIYFQGTRYRITRGRIDFVNPARLDPRLDLEAEADVRDYRIILSLTGTADKLRADLRSDPPLPGVDVFNLVSSGVTGAGDSGAAFRSGGGASRGRQQEGSSAASTLLSEGLSLKYGSTVKRIFGLDRFRVDPFLVGNERDPTTRVTFGQQVTKDLSITYSTSVSSSEEQVIILEYDVNDEAAVIGSRDADGAFGVDLHFRKRIGRKRP